MDAKLQAAELTEFLQILGGSIVSIRLPKLTDEDVVHFQEICYFLQSGTQTLSLFKLRKVVLLIVVVTHLFLNENLLFQWKFQ